MIIDIVEEIIKNKIKSVSNKQQIRRLLEVVLKKRNISISCYIIVPGQRIDCCHKDLKFTLYINHNTLWCKYNMTIYSLQEFLNELNIEQNKEWEDRVERRLFEII